MKKYPLMLNLQLFADGEDDMILPDDFEDTPTEESQELQEDTFDTDAEDTKPAEEQTETEQPEKVIETPKIKVKYNSEEREITADEAAVLAQKGMNYEKAVERAKQEARDAYIAEQGHEWQGKRIATEAEYKQAIMERDLMEKYRDQGLPDEVVQELIENRKFREQYQSQQTEQQEKSKQDEQYTDFIASFPNVDPKTITEETWDKVKSGVQLKYAYMEQEYAAIVAKEKVREQNQQNKQKAPVRSVADHGTGEITSDPFLEGFDSI